ncbi:MAG: SPFH domain-containing protein [Bacteroidetes bacterium]|uniref:SPFH domain-containing protein n=1 Tax=Candidatus Pullibacteroides excrementavium TaxID=2840905 RepID=A0A9D9DSW1_9BACT|nr:SPFH domain-containing protein [Candidatus Pullibacteroides excrementavium]
MGLFGLGSRGKSGGMMNVIRCDEQEYLVWKWRPAGQEANSTTRENSIRYGSSLRVKDGEVAVFVYKQKDGTMQDYIEGPYDDIIKTANFPVLSSIVGLAFGGESPFQAEIYFINLAGNVQIKFGIPYFDVFDPRFLDFAVPMAVRGSITFNITDYKAFIKLNRMINFTLEDFKNQVKDAVTKSIKSFVTNAPQNNGIPVLQIERKITEISDLIQERLAKEMREDFGVNLKRIDLADIEVDKESDGYRELRHITAGQQAQTIQAQTDVNIKNLQDTQAINAENVQESLRIQREEAQRAQRLQTETNFIGAHALDQQTSVLKAGAESLGSMSHVGDGGGMNAAGMMTGMVMGGAMGNQMAGMMNNLGQQMQNSMNTPPPPPTPNYMVSMNGQQSGPFNIQQLQQLAQQGQINAQTYVWKQGMSNWVMAGQVQELASLFIASTPPPPPPTL